MWKYNGEGLTTRLPRGKWQKNHEKIGEERGRIEGIREGRLEGKIELLVNLVNDEIITCSEAAKRAGMSKEEFMEKYLKK